MNQKKKLTTREQLFCEYLALLGMPFEAARRAGYSRQQRPRAVLELLENDEVRRQVEQLQGMMQEYLPAAALCGLAKIAFGDANDAVRLAVMEQPPGKEELEKMDLFAVSELRRRHDGMLEVKLADRMQAMELLLEHAQRFGRADGVEKLIEGLSRSACAQAVRQGDAG